MEVQLNDKEQNYHDIHDRRTIFSHKWSNCRF